MTEQKRPLDNFIGNKDAIARVKLHIAAAIKRGKMPGHLALLGPKGRGKTMLSECIAEELSSIFYIFNAASIRSPRDMRNVLAHMCLNPAHSAVIAIDEVHALGRGATNCLLSAMESGIVTSDYEGEIINEKITQPHLIIIMTTDENRVFPPLLSRCDKIYLRPYSAEECATIARNNIVSGGFSVDEASVNKIAERSNGEARQVVHYARNLCDLATVCEVEMITGEITDELFNKILKVDDLGLQERDRELLRIMSRLGTSSLETLANMMDEPKENLHQRECMLLKNGLIRITGGGRELTSKGRGYIGESVVKTLHWRD